MDGERTAMLPFRRIAFLFYCGIDSPCDGRRRLPPCLPACLLPTAFSNSVIRCPISETGVAGQMPMVRALALSVLSGTHDAWPCPPAKLRPGPRGAVGFFCRQQHELGSHDCLGRSNIGVLEAVETDSA